MISNDYTWSPERRKQQQPYHESAASKPPRPFVQEDTLKTAEVQIERKYFIMLLKENPRGCFLRITEEVGDKRNSIIVPSTGLRDFQKLLAEMVAAANEIPAKTPPNETPPAQAPV